MRVFFDSSSLFKRYVAESGSDLVIKSCQDADEICVSAICSVEILSSLNRLHREKKLSKPLFKLVKQNFLKDIDEATAIPLTDDVLHQSYDCLEKTPLRAMDAIHVASAITAGCDLFVTSDKRQAAAAKTMNLTVKVV